VRAACTKLPSSLVALAIKKTHCRAITVTATLDVPKNFFAVLYVSVMGLTRCYKTTVFYIYICSFFTKFILQLYIIAQAYLRCCGVAKTNGSNTGMLLLAVSIW